MSFVKLQLQKTKSVTYKVNVIHLKSLNAACKTGKISGRKKWTCKICEPITLSSLDSNFEGIIINTLEINDTDTLQKSIFVHIAYLKYKIFLLNKLLNEIDEVNKESTVKSVNSV